METVRHKHRVAHSKCLNQSVTQLSHRPLRFCRGLDLTPHPAASAHGKPVTGRKIADLSITYFKTTVRKQTVSKSFRSTIESYRPK